MSMINMQALLEDLLARGLAEGAFPSAAAAAGIKGDVLACACVGSTRTDGGLPVTSKTLYDMASLTKILAPTMIALRAVEDGLLTLDDTIGRFIKDAPADRADITVRMLMSHTSGITPAFDLSAEAASPADVVRAILAHPLEGESGVPRYSCMGYMILARMLEILFEKPLDELARDMVFKPLGMSATGYLPTGGDIAATEISRRTGRLICGVVHDENARFLGGVSGNAGVFSNLDDMLRFTSMLAKGGDGYLSPAVLRMAIRNLTPGFDTHRGLGFHLAGVPGNFMGDLFPPESFGHTGFTGVSIAIDPRTGFYVILLTNRVHPSRENIRIMRFRRAFHNALYAKNPGCI